jgi:DNA-binding MarR family transcriptional regulator
MNTWKSPLGGSRAGVVAEVLETSELFAEVFRLQAAVVAAMEEMARESGLTGARWQVLCALADGPVTVASAARSLGLARQSVQRTADGLVDSGFVEYRDNPDHVRARLAYLTGQGRVAVEKLRADQAEWLETIARDLPPANLRIAKGVVRGLIGRVVGLE